jgi:endonuclease YncB( thermonuclease family)
MLRFGKVVGMRQLRLALLLFLLLPSIASAETFKGKVIGVSDGDTITVLRDNKPIKIRLHGVDCPEMKQPFGKKAKQFTSAFVFGKQVIVNVVTKDRTGRAGARIIIFRQLAPHAKSLGFDLGTELVKAGLAWWSRKYDPTNESLAELEAYAKKIKQGLWADKTPVAPWDWRRNKRSSSPFCRTKKDCRLLLCCCSFIALAPDEKPPGRCKRPCSCPKIFQPSGVRCHQGACKVLLKPPPKPTLQQVLYCNVKSKVCHRPNCKYYGCKNCTATFGSEAEAKKAGYRMHQ